MGWVKPITHGWDMRKMLIISLILRKQDLCLHVTMQTAGGIF
jgi:hypothetical protein